MKIICTKNLVILRFCVFYYNSAVFQNKKNRDNIICYLYLIVIYNVSKLKSYPHYKTPLPLIIVIVMYSNEYLLLFYVKIVNNPQTTK